MENAEIKTPDVSKLVTNIALNTKIGEVENKTSHHEVYIITQELNK